MKITRFFSLRRSSGVLCAACMAVTVSLPQNGMGQAVQGQQEGKPFIGQTNKDVPADFHKYFGQRVNSWRDTERQIAKIDLDADMNQDGNMNNTDPADGGAFEATPPGMVLGEGEMTRVVLRLLPYRVDFDGEVVVTLEVEGINRGSRTGEYATQDEEISDMGHIRVWRDKAKTQLVIDSRDPAKRVAEFTTQYKTYPYNLPIAVPRFFYVEGVRTSPKYIGDVRLLATVSHRSTENKSAGPVVAFDVAEPVTLSKQPVTAAKEPSPVQPEEKKVGVKSFRTSFDHILFTVQKNPLLKQFINDNNAGNWVPPPGKPY